MKQYFKTVLSEGKEDVKKIVALAVGAGVAQGIIVAVINSASGSATEDELNLRYLVMFLLAMSAYVVTKYQSLIRSSMLIEKIVKSFRDKISDKIRRSHLDKYEEVEKSAFFTPLSRDTNELAEATPAIINASASCVMLLAMGVYIAVVSKVALFMIALVVTIAIVNFLRMDKASRKKLSDAVAAENKFFSHLNHLLEGFKEIKMSKVKSDDLYSNYIKNATSQAADNKVAAAFLFFRMVVFSQSFLFLLVGSVVFLLPSLSSVTPDQMMKLTATCLFLIGPISDIAMSIPFMAKAEIALTNLHNLESKLDAEENVDENHPSVIRMKKVSQPDVISCERLEFAYKDKNDNTLFQVGPVNLTFKKGETVFIAGGNGCGKSTFLKIFTGLYQPSKGGLRINDTAVDPYNVSFYREQFSIIFTDFHLFDRLYGLDNIDVDRVEELLDVLKLRDKTGFADGKFTNTDLSTGQKKRLALLIALMEDRPVCIFDEVAADQDPHFRKYLYETFFPSLKKQGKTIIAVTHDDRYFDTADRLLRMEYGNFVQE